MASDAPPKPSAKPKPSGRKAKRLSQKEQSERFVEAALRLEADESGERFKRALDTVLPVDNDTARKQSVKGAPKNRAVKNPRAP